MELQMFTVYDSKAEAYLSPFFFPSRGQAVRAFGDMSNDQNHSFNKHPEDYTLFCLGTFEDETGTMHLLPTKESLGLAIEFKDPLPPPPMALRQVDTRGGV